MPIYLQGQWDPEKILLDSESSQSLRKWNNGQKLVAFSVILAIFGFFMGLPLLVGYKEHESLRAIFTDMNQLTKNKTATSMKVLTVYKEVHSR